MEPVTRKYEIGQIVIQHGQVIRAEDLEALQTIGLVDTRFSINTILSSSALVIVLMVFIALYGVRRQGSPMDDLRSLLLISFTFLFFLILGRLIIPYRTVIPFIFPAAAFGLTLATAFSLETGLIFSLVLSLLVAYGLPGSLEITIFYIVGSFCGVLVSGTRTEYRIVFPSQHCDERCQCPGHHGLPPVRSGHRLDRSRHTDRSIDHQWICGCQCHPHPSIHLFSIPGDHDCLQLLDISRPDHPLLQFMLRNAPGTYQHSLQVANLAEQAAEAINADSLLVRVGALYHDAGKAMNPQFFIENQIKGNPNPHEDLDPLTSAGVIVKHIGDGVALARKYNLPPRLQDFIREHHGTLITRYQYNRAVTENGNDESKVDIEAYRYPGPSPRSRETALLMLADGCEARARAELPKDEIELRSMVKKVIDKCLIDGQLG